MPTLSEEDKKNKKAVAIKYDKGQNSAPHVSAKGRGVLAAKIIAIAKEHDVPIHSDADLVEILDKVEIEQEIPLEVYTIVAEIFAYIYKVNKKKK
ncbi:MAG: flagellar biosynthesis protein [Alphaproteobacteria bacterium]